MPTYEYVCTKCGEGLEAVQKFSDPPLSKCPHCKGKLRKVFSPVGVVFKGSGFYKTDSRNSKSASSTPAKESTKEPASSDSSSSSSDSGSSSTPSTSDSSSTGKSDSGSSSSNKKKDGGSKVA